MRRYSPISWLINKLTKLSPVILIIYYENRAEKLHKHRQTTMLNVFNMATSKWEKSHCTWKTLRRYIRRFRMKAASTFQPRTDGGTLFMTQTTRSRTNAAIASQWCTTSVTCCTHQPTLTSKPTTTDNDRQLPKLGRAYKSGNSGFVHHNRWASEQFLNGTSALLRPFGASYRL